jgi:hypothetical protein
VRRRIARGIVSVRIDVVVVPATTTPLVALVARGVRGLRFREGGLGRVVTSSRRAAASPPWPKCCSATRPARHGGDEDNRAEKKQHDRSGVGEKPEQGSHAATATWV